MVAFPPSPQRIQTLEALRAQIERLESGVGTPPRLAADGGGPARDASGAGVPAGAVGRRDAAGRRDATAKRDVVPTGWPSVDAWLPGGLPRGVVTEWFGLPEDGLPEEGEGEAAEGETAEGGEAAAADGPRVPPRTTARSKARGTPPSVWTPPLSVLVHLAHQVLRSPPAGASDASASTERVRPDRMDAGRAGPVLWIGRRVWPYGRALVRAGPKGAQLLARSLFVATPDEAVGVRGRRARGGRTDPGSPDDAGARLWALDLALRCRAVAAVVADGRGFAMAASRRLQVAAEAGHAFVVLARPAEEFDVPSAAAVRFVVTRAAIDADARPGAPRSCAWSITLRRAKGAAARTRASVVSPAATSPPSSSSSPSSSLRESSLRTAHGPEGPAVVLVWDAVHGVIERGTEPALADGGERSHAATDPGVVPAVVLDRPLAATVHASGCGAARLGPNPPGAGRSDTNRPEAGRRRRRTRTRR